MTALGGLPLYLELAHVLGVVDSIRQHPGESEHAHSVMK
jgi:hypothetical protein